MHDADFLAVTPAEKEAVRQREADRRAHNLARLTRLAPYLVIMVTWVAIMPALVAMAITGGDVSESELQAMGALAGAALLVSVSALYFG